MVPCLLFNFAKTWNVWIKIGKIWIKLAKNRKKTFFKMPKSTILKWGKTAILKKSYFFGNFFKGFSYFLLV